MLSMQLAEQMLQMQLPETTLSSRQGGTSFADRSELPFLLTRCRAAPASGRCAAPH